MNGDHRYRTAPASDAYRDGFDRIFRKDVAQSDGVELNGGLNVVPHPKMIERLAQGLEKK